MRTKDYRRAKTESKLVRKAKLMYQSEWYINKTMTYADFIKEVKAGQKHKWMRSQNTPCSCYMCSGYYKYRRQANLTTQTILKALD